MQVYRSPTQSQKFVRNALDVQYRSKLAKYYLKWGTINMVMLSILVYDINTRCFDDTNYVVMWIEFAFLSFCSLSMVACFIKYLWFIFAKPPFYCTQEQKQLLCNNDSEKSFVVLSPNKDVDSHKNKSPTKINVNWHSSFNESYGKQSPSWNLACTTPPQSGRTSISPQKQTTINNSWNSSYNNSTMNMSTLSSQTSFSSPYKHYTADDVIDDERGLRRYLKEVSIRESSITDVHELQNEMGLSTVNSFWNYCNAAANYLLRTSVYQLAPSPIPANQSTKQNSLDDSFKMLDGTSELIKGISSEKLSQYVTNLRVWIATTILQRLVHEIKAIDDVFKNKGFIDIQIGKVSLDRLKKLSEMPEIIECMPKLSVLLPFLSLISNQEYLVQRIKDLAASSCIADYRWNSGFSYNDSKWDDHLPSDAALIFHLFCVYLDYQLLPLPQAGGRPFHSRYVIQGDDSRSPKEAIAAVNNKANCAIYYNNANKPKFNFISEKQFHNCSYNRNNLFYVIIQFLMYMKNHQDGQLEGVNLGKTGINILCVIQD